MTLSRTECTALRGLAIVAIALHNYCHFIGHIVKENEYLYQVKNNDDLWRVLTHPDELLPVHLLSYFGHFGVPVFLFLSGFGLVMKYEASAAPCEQCGVLSFLRYNYLKLLRMLIVGFVLFVMVDAVTPGRFHFYWYNVLAQLAMAINALPTNRVIWPGIYWFFGLMMELYVVYRLLLYRRHWLYVVSLVVACWLAQVFCDPAGKLLDYLRYNFIGSMLPFGAGILFARYGHRLGTSERPRYQWALMALTAIALVLLMSFSFYSWLWIPLFIIVGSIAIIKLLPSSLLNIAVWLGGLSAAIFVAHPISRRLLIVVAWKDGIYDGLMLYVVVTIGLSWAVKQIIDRLPAPTSHH